MSITKIRGKSQIMSASIDVDKLMDDFLKSHVWQVSTDNTATIRGLATPSNNNDAANKAYVDAVKTYADNLIKGLKYKSEVDLIAKSNITLAGSQTIDGVTTTIGMRVAVIGQTNPIQNGIYVTSASSWARATDFDVGYSAGSSYFFVQLGNTEKDTAYVCANDKGDDIVGTASLTFIKFTSASSYNAGFGISIETGNSLQVNTQAIVDDVTLTYDVATKKIKVKLIDKNNIDFGVGVDQVKAADLPIEPISGLTADNTQDAISELKTLIETSISSYTKKNQVLVVTAGVAEPLSVVGQTITVIPDSIQLYFNGMRMRMGAVNQSDPSNKDFWHDFIFNPATRVITLSDNTISSNPDTFIVDFEYNI